MRVHAQGCYVQDNVFARTCGVCANDPTVGPHIWSPLWTCCRIREPQRRLCKDLPWPWLMNAPSRSDQLSCPLAPAQNFDPTSSGCCEPWNDAVRGLESIGNGSNACWIEEDKDAVQAAGRENKLSHRCVFNIPLRMHPYVDQTNFINYIFYCMKNKALPYPAFLWFSLYPSPKTLSNLNKSDSNEWGQFL